MHFWARRDSGQTHATGENDLTGLRGGLNGAMQH
jgi:hypothetical protein